MRPSKLFFIILGDACNANCRYCIERTKTQERKEINPKIYDFFRNTLKKSEIQAISFYGGEPTLYFDQMKEIVETLSDTNIRFNTMTNGLSINDEMVDFFNKHNMSVSLSWDGDNSDLTRGFNVIKLNPRVLNINHLWLSGVITKFSPLSSIVESDSRVNEEFKRIHGFSLRVHINTVIKSYEDEIFDIDLIRLRKEQKYYLTKDPENEVEHYMQKLHILQHPLPQDEIRFSPLAKCNIGFCMWVMNVRGEFYNCKNFREIIGTIDSSEKDILIESISRDSGLDMIEKCKECNITTLCRGGCRYIPYREHFCAVQKAVYEPMAEVMNNTELINRKILNGGLRFY